MAKLLVARKGDFIVKARLFVMILMLLILLAGCSQASKTVETSDSAEVVQESTATQEPTAVPSTNTPQPEPTEMAVTEQPASGETDPTTEPSAGARPEPTPIPCDGVLTTPNQEGPFYSPGSPERRSLIDEGMPGVPTLIFGRVFDQDCNPIAGAKLDFWLADVNGEYDNAGYTLRGHLYTDENGYYALESIQPTAYTGRPPHIHVKIFAQDGRELLTTQMYFAGSESSADVLAAPDLLVNYLEPDETGRLQVLFNFVVQN